MFIGAAARSSSASTYEHWCPGNLHAEFHDVFGQETME
jgi:hypothetical protein